MKNVLRYMLLFLLLCFAFNIKALEVSKNNLTLKPGESDTISLYANTETEVTSINFTLIYTSYDVPATFKVADGLTYTASSTKHSISFKEPQKGKILLGTINTNVVTKPNGKSGITRIHTASAKDTLDNTISLTSTSITTTIDLSKQTLTKKQVTTTEETKPTVIEEPKVEENQEIQPNEIVLDTDLLSSIESNIVKIDIKPGVYDYNISIDKNILELDLKGIAKTPDTEVTTTTQKVSELVDNKIIIKAKTSDAEQDYTIKVKIKEEVINKENNNYKKKWIVISLFMIISLCVSLFFIKK